MGDDLRSSTMNMDLDLNVEPLDSSTGSALRLGSLLDELENTHGQIEERIRQLETVTARARQRQRIRHTRNYSDLTVLSQQEIGTIERTKYGKRDRTCLVAEALELNNNRSISKCIGDGSGFFDCNLCLNMAKEPVLTSCGHLFCWVCFYHLPYIYSTAKECPSCKGEIMENNIVPIYGNGENNKSKNLDLHQKIPPRPKARRVETPREQPENQRVSHTRTFSRVLSESAASLSSISSAINNAERLVEDLESYLRIRGIRRPTDSNILLPVNEAEASNGIVAGTGASPEEEQLASMMTLRRRLPVQRISDSENGTMRELRRRRLI
ncbi:uncharacterized protein LOC124914844 [Impatiens glandulifera]|uniref:uncharacterized protein LOC124914844 n=1 Tax=Impatiens glandulifera TaxID=253017 RepID=UPI001FB19F0E|nr:uncharacterized protein LOC124914844 [Impatiens glandulifera]